MSPKPQLALPKVRSRLSRTGLVMCPLRDFAGFTGLLDDQVVVVGFDDAFELWILVAGKDEEEPRGPSHPLVDIESDRELLGAAFVRAFADKRGLGDRGGMAFLEARDVLVDLTEQGLVTSSTLFPD